MLYIIDGYNLMFRIWKTDDDLQGPREALIKDLDQKMAILKLNVILVFDAQYQERDTAFIQQKNLEIHFTEHGETADDYIVKLVKKSANPLNITVITSDNKLSWLTRRINGKTQSVDLFLKWINNKYRNTLKKENTPFTKRETFLEKTAKNPSKAPLEESTKEYCFSFYLDHFQKEFEKMIIEKEIKKEAKLKNSKKLKSSKKSKTTHEKQDFTLTNYERWLKAFERNIASSD